MGSREADRARLCGGRRVCRKVLAAESVGRGVRGVQVRVCERRREGEGRREREEGEAESVPNPVRGDGEDARSIHVGTGGQAMFGGYGSRARWRERLIASATSRCCFAVLPVMRRGRIFPVSERKLRSSFGSL